MASDYDVGRVLADGWVARDKVGRRALGRFGRKIPDGLLVERKFLQTILHFALAPNSWVLWPGGEPSLDLIPRFVIIRY
jgi:hypothetical protein